jgi:hypothetical protein
VGFVGYRDYSDGIARLGGLSVSSDVDGVVRVLDGVVAKGDGDGPEDGAVGSTSSLQTGIRACVPHGHLAQRVVFEESVLAMTDAN